MAQFCSLRRMYFVLSFMFFSLVRGQPLESTTEAVPSDEATGEVVEEEDYPKPMSGDYYNTFHNLHLQILQSYNPHIRPEIGAGKPMTCNFSMVVTHLGHVNEDAQTVDFHGWIILQWYDHRLAWNDSVEFTEIAKLLMDQKFIWKPDVHLYNNAESKVDRVVSSSTQAQVFKDGRVLIDPAFSLSPYCQFNFRHYPWETHKCAVYVGSWAYRTHELKWQLRLITPDAVSVVFSNSRRTFPTDWFITDAFVQLDEVKFDGERWHHVNVTFHIKRSTTFAANFVLVPAAVTTALTTFAFLLSTNRIDWKLAILVAALVLQLIHYMAIHAVLPQGVINGGPLIITLCKANIFVTIVSFVFATIFKLIFDRSDDPPFWIRRIVDHKIFNSVCCFQEDFHEPLNRYSMKSIPNRRQGQREPILVTNQLIPPKRASKLQPLDEQEKPIATTSKATDEDTRSWSDRCEVPGRRRAQWWRFSVALDRIMFVILALVHAVLWACYVGI